MSDYAVINCRVMKCPYTLKRMLMLCLQNWGAWAPWTPPCLRHCCMQWKHSIPYTLCLKKTSPTFSTVTWKSIIRFW